MPFCAYSTLSRSLLLFTLIIIPTFVSLVSGAGCLYCQPKDAQNPNVQLDDCKPITGCHPTPSREGFLLINSDWSRGNCIGCYCGFYLDNPDTSRAECKKGCDSRAKGRYCR